MNPTYNIVSHTHWDREWYQTQEQFRTRLVDLMDRLLDILEVEPRFRFHLDAQTIVLEDYLDIRPEKETLLAGYIRSGRLFVGPWYIQNDFSLTSGESTVRNLLLGTRMAQRFGFCSEIGYVPDQFGLCGQLPQILSRSGIAYCVFGRGLVLKEGDASEFLWRSSDGSSVFCVFLPFWYNNAQRFSPSIDRSMNLLDSIRTNSLKHASVSQLLLMNGVDHLEAQEDLFAIIDEISPRLPEGTAIRQVSFAEYLQSVAEELAATGRISNLRTYGGEMREGPETSILPGTLSSRAGLKRRNARAQALLERRLEPLSCMADALGVKEYQQGYLDFLWKLLLQNHPHDSICGCHLDAIAGHMNDRFDRLEEAGLMLQKKAMDVLMEHVGRIGFSPTDTLIGVFNTEPRARSGWVDADMDIPEADDLGSVLVLDGHGDSIRFDVLERKARAIGLASPINLPGVVPVASYKLRLYVEDIQAMGFKVYRAVRTERAGTAGQPMAAQAGIPRLERPGKTILENSDCRVRVDEGGTLEYACLRTGKVFPGLMLLEDREDCGDSYIYKEDPSMEPIMGCAGKAEIRVSELNAGTECTIAYSLRIPECWDYEQGRRSDVLVEVPVLITLFLPLRGRRLDIRVSVDNTAQDHRMRFLFPTNSGANESFAAAPFELACRKTGTPSGADPVRCHPNAGLVTAGDADCALAILNEGMYEYEHKQDGSILALTLFRGNSFIARNDSLPLAEDWIVPGNQCLGIHECRLGIMAQGGESGRGSLLAERDSFLNPLYACSQAADVRRFSGGRPFVQDSALGDIFYRPKSNPALDLGSEYSFFRLEGEGIVLSSVRKGDARNSWMIRLFNSLGHPSSGSIHFADASRVRPIEAWELTLLDGRIRRLDTASGERLDLQFESGRILSVEVILDGE
jgi:alpha-mannosidase